MITPNPSAVRRAELIADMPVHTNSTDRVTIYDVFKVAMFRLAYKLQLGETRPGPTVAFANALIETQDRRHSDIEMTGLWMWYRTFWLPRQYPKLYAALRGTLENRCLAAPSDAPLFAEPAQ